MRYWLPLFLVGLMSSPVLALEDSDIRSLFGDRDACLVLSDLSTRKIILEYNPKRCMRRFPPCSSFKIAAALMAFEGKVLRDESEIIKWDGIRRNREELNQDQTPFLWMKNSAMWVTQWITPQLGLETIRRFLEIFSYGNQDFSGGIMAAWQDSTLKISAREQLAFITRLWKDDLPVSKRSMELTKKIIFVKKLPNGSELFGKTGTGCIDSGCDAHPGRMLGWFVGVLKAGTKEYAFAANASDRRSYGLPAGPRMRETIVTIFQKLGQ